MRQDYIDYVEKDDGIFATIIIKYFTNFSFISEVNFVIRNILEKHSVEQENIIDFSVTKKGEKVKIKLTYTKFNLLAIAKINSEKEQIIAVLKELGYPDEKIKKVEYENQGSDEIDSKIWKIEINEYYDLDENFSQRSNEISISQKINKVLGFNAKVKFVI